MLRFIVICFQIYEAAKLANADDFIRNFPGVSNFISYFSRSVERCFTTDQVIHTYQILFQARMVFHMYNIFQIGIGLFADPSFIYHAKKI